MTSETTSKGQGPSAKSQRRAAEQRRQRRNLWMGVGAAIAVVVVVAVILLSPKSSPPGGDGTSPAGSVTISRASGPQLVAGDQVPEFSAPKMGGGTLKWADFAGHPIVLAIWAPWCPHCQKELPILASSQAKYSSVQIVSVATATAQGGPTPQQYMSDNGLTFPVGLDDANQTILKGMGVGSFPTVYYVGSDGKVVVATVGEVDPAQIDAYFAQLQSS